MEGSNASVRNLMVYNYGNKCWLNGVITKNNPLTYHHIKAKRDGGECTEENGALLTRDRHDLFNKLELYYPELAAEVNRYFIIYKGDYPEEVLDRIEKLMELTERISVKKKKKKRKY